MQLIPGPLYLLVISWRKTRWMLLPSTRRNADVLTTGHVCSLAAVMLPSQSMPCFTGAISRAFLFLSQSPEQQRHLRRGRHRSSAWESEALRLPFRRWDFAEHAVPEGRWSHACVQCAEHRGDCCQAKCEAQGGDDQPGSARNMQLGGAPFLLYYGIPGLEHHSMHSQATDTLSMLMYTTQDFIHADHGLPCTMMGRGVMLS